MGSPVFIRTSEGVLLRFEDPSVIRQWIETGRLQWNDRFLGIDQAWHPLTDLLDFSRAMGAPPGFPQPDSKGQSSRPDVSGARLGVDPAGGGDPRRTAEWLSPPPGVADSSPVPVAEVPIPLSPHAPVGDGFSGDAAGPDPSGQGPTKYREGEERSEPPAEGEWWASDPGGSGSFPFRRAIVLVSIGVVAMGMGLGLWWVGGTESDGSRDPASGTALAGSEQDPGPNELALQGDPGVARRDGGVEEDGPPESPTDDGNRSIKPTPTARAEGAPLPSMVGSPAGSESRRGAEADRRAAPAAQETPNTYDEHMEAGNRLMSSRPDAAMAHFLRAAQLRPNRVEPHSRMGDLAMQQQDLVSAERHYREALRRNAEYGPTILGMARLYRRKGNRDDARYWYTRYLERFPQGSGASEARAFLEAP